MCYEGTLVNHVNLLQVVEDEYTRNGARLDLSFDDVQFEQEQITLDIQDEITNGGWKITPYIQPFKVHLHYIYNATKAG